MLSIGIAIDAEKAITTKTRKELNYDISCSLLQEQTHATVGFSRVS